MRREETMRIHVSSLGCKLNQSEMDTLAAQLAARGHQLVTTPAEADLCVLNTCAVTHVAAQKSRQALRRLHRQNPGARLIATGCYAELTPADLRDLPGVELVVDNKGKDHLHEYLAAEETSAVRPPPFPLRPSRTRALVKIQDGCDNACTYCIIRVARGEQRSRPPDQVLAEVQARLEAGHQEVVLTGVHIGAYGRDRVPGAWPSEARPEPVEINIWDLVARILAETDVPRLRLSSIEPWDLSASAFALWNDPRLCRHLHLPLQSGCDATLRRMNRHYTTGEFRSLVESARSAIPDLAVTTDVIVGFPGETDAEFSTSLAFIRDLGLSRVHVFPYSLRPGTAAAAMPDQVPPQVKAQRARDLREVAAASGQAFRQQFVGRTMDALWEAAKPAEEGPRWSGLTDNYLRVYTSSPADLTNTLTPTRLVSLTENGLQGQIVD
jgi:threonylcarbamoyladenosine tRNA methylthiotransferase MtaB